MCVTFSTGKTSNGKLIVWTNGFNSSQSIGIQFYGDASWIYNHPWIRTNIESSIKEALNEQVCLLLNEEITKYSQELNLAMKVTLQE